ncbi:hypothetical protein HRU87_02250 [Aquiluna borgnonia]|uniref:Uncharacterized protein n=1 Tax=Aquiluna borgnonia TaxID=2499157 RepID=A0A7D4Q4G9_9MICO|nr:hypothetical protein [Aquiluna borgnonia]QKJ25043.1 hypothetical protein HRU87_02250 [Aquiluna borgnonia]
MTPARVTFLVGLDNPDYLEIVARISQLFPALSLEIAQEFDSLTGGDVLIALSFPKKVPSRVTSKFRLAAVIHASPLPVGRGWSPANWMLENMETDFTLTLLKMADEIDSGDIIDTQRFQVPLSGIYCDFRVALIENQVKLLERLLTGSLPISSSAPQIGSPTYYNRRTPRNSELDPGVSISEQWGKIRAADSQRYPNYFYLYGRKFKVTIEGME